MDQIMSMMNLWDGEHLAMYVFFDDLYFCILFLLFLLFQTLRTCNKSCYEYENACLWQQQVDKLYMLHQWHGWCSLPIKNETCTSVARLVFSWIFINVCFVFSQFCVWNWLVYCGSSAADGLHIYYYYYY